MHQRLIRIAAVLIAAAFLAQPAHGAIVEQELTKSGTVIGSARDLSAALEDALASRFDDQEAERVVAAADAFTRAGGVLPDDALAFIEAMDHPAGRRIYAAFLDLQGPDVTVDDLRGMQERVETAWAVESGRLDVKGIPGGPMSLLDGVLGQLDLSDPETIEASWNALDPALRAVSVDAFAAVAEGWAGASDNAAATATRDAAREMLAHDPYDVADGKVPLPRTEAAVASLTDALDATLLGVTDPGVMGLPDGVAPADAVFVSDALRAELGTLLDTEEGRANLEALLGGSLAEAPVDVGAPLTATKATPNYFPRSGVSFWGDGGTGSDSSAAAPVSVARPDANRGRSVAGVLEPGDDEDAYVVALDGTSSAIWNVYLGVAGSALPLRLTASYVDASNRTVDLALPKISHGSMVTATPPVPGTGDMTRVTLAIPTPPADHTLRLRVSHADGEPGATRAEYVLTVERFEEDEGVTTGHTHVADVVPSGRFTADSFDGDADPVMLVHGFMAGAGTWDQESTPSASGDWLRSPWIGSTLLGILFLFEMVGTVILLVKLARLVSFITNIFIAILVITMMVVLVGNLVLTMDHALSMAWSLSRVNAGRTSDGLTTVETLSNAGFFVGTFTYHQKFGFEKTNFASRGSVQDSGYDLRHGINVLQQAYWNEQRERDPDGFPFRHPDEIKVSLVGHSMGGMVSRWYTQQRSDTVSVGAMTLPTYDGDVRKVIQLGTPNGGSSIAQTIHDDVIGCDGKGGLLILRVLFGIMLSVGLAALYLEMGKAWWSFSLQFVSTAAAWALEGFRVIILHVFTCRVLDAGLHRIGVTELLPSTSTVVPTFAGNTNPDVEYAIIYGVPLVTWYGNIRLFDMFVSEEDALGDAHFRAKAASWYTYDSHSGLTTNAKVKDLVIQYLDAAEGVSLKGVADMDEAWPDDEFNRADGWITTWRVSNAIADFLKDASFGSNLKKLVLQKLGPILISRLAHSSSADGTEVWYGNRAEALNRLAEKKGLEPGAYGTILNPDVPPTLIDDPNATLDEDSITVRDRAPDVAIVDAGDVGGAGQWFDSAGEPTTRRGIRDVAERADQRVLAIAPGAVDALRHDKSWKEATGAHLARGGTLLVMNQLTGADWAAVPGAPRAYGALEAARAKEGHVAISTFTDALAGQWNATPAMSTDGFFLRLPANATVLLRDMPSGHAVAAAYPWGGGTVVVLAVDPMTDAEGLMTEDERRLLRDIVNADRGDAPTAAAPAGATITLHVVVTNPTDTAVEAVSLSLVDPHLIPVNRTLVTVSIPPGETRTVGFTFTAPGQEGIWSVDARLRSADTTVLGDVYDLTRFRVSPFQGGPNGFTVAGDPVTVTIVADRDSVLRGEDAALTAHVTNQGDDPVDARLEWWAPAHDARLPGSGYGPAFANGVDLTLAAGETAEVPVTVAAVATDDTLRARLLVDGTAAGRVAFPITVYDPTVAVAVRTPSATVIPGSPVDVDIRVRDTADGASDRAGIAHVVLVDPSGLPVETVDVPLAVGGTASTVTVALTPPAGVTGTYTIRAEALVDGLVRGRGARAIDVPARALAVSVEWDRATGFDTGIATFVSVDLAHRGHAPVDSGSVRLDLVNATGSITWTATESFALAPGMTHATGFPVTPADADRGTHRLRTTVTTEDGPVVHENPVVSRTATRVDRSPGILRAGESGALDVRVLNAGDFRVRGAYAATAAGLDTGSATTLDLMPGDTASLSIPITAPADVAPGTYALEAGIGGLSVTRIVYVPPGRATVEAPAMATWTAGATVPVTLANAGGVPVTASAHARLVDAAGTTVAMADLAATLLGPLATASVSLEIPVWAATGTYRLILESRSDDGEDGRVHRTIDVDGATATLALTANAAVADVGGIASVHAESAALAGVLDDARLRLRILDPTPRPTPEAVVDGASITHVAQGRETWFVTDARRLSRVAAAGVERVALPDALKGADILDLAAGGGTTLVATEEAIAMHRDDAWTVLPAAPGVTTRLAVSPEGIPFVGTKTGVFEWTTAAWVPVGNPGTAITALAVDDLQVVAGIADTETRLARAAAAFSPAPVSASFSVLLDAGSGRSHVLYPADDAVQHVLVDAGGRVIRGPAAITEPAAGTGGIAAARLPDGSVALAWHDASAGGRDVRYMRLDPNGAPMGTPVALTSHKEAQRNPTIAVDPSGDVHVVWTDARHPAPDGSTQDDLYHQRVSRDGVPLGSEHRLTATPGLERWSRVVVTDEGIVHVGHLIIEWRQVGGYRTGFIETRHVAIDADGAVVSPPRYVSVSDDDFSIFPEVAYDRANDLVHFVYQDRRLGTYGIYHRALNATTGAFTGPDHVLLDAVSFPVTATATDGAWLAWSKDGGSHVARFTPDGLEGTLRLDDVDAGRIIAAPSRDGIRIAWDATVDGTRELRFARTTEDPVGRGLVTIDRASGTTRPLLDTGLVSDVATTFTDVYAATADGLIRIRADPGTTATIPYTTPVHVATGATKVAFADARSAGRLIDDLPAAVPNAPGAIRGIAVDGNDILVATTQGLYRYPADPATVLAEQETALGGPGALDVDFTVPGPMNRHIVEARIVNAAGQTLAMNRTTYHALAGNVVLTLTPGAASARPGDEVPVTLTVANRGPLPERTLSLQLVAAGVTLAADTFDLAAGDSRTVTATFRAAGATHLIATASQPATGTLARVHDHVPLEGTVTARLIGPAEATTDDFAVHGILENADDRARRVTATLDGRDPRTVTLPAGGVTTVSWPEITQTASTTHVLEVVGTDTTTEARLTVAQAPGVELALDAADVVTPGAHAFALTLTNPASLPVDAAVTVTVDSVEVHTGTVRLDAGASASESVTMELTPGDHLVVATTADTILEHTITASATPVVALTPAFPESLAPGTPVRADVHLRGPHAIRGTVEWDLGFMVTTAPLVLSPGDSTTASVTPDLRDVAPGSYPATVRVVIDGATVAEAAGTVGIAAPPIRLDGNPSAHDVDAGSLLTYVVTVTNDGITPANVPVTATLGAYGIDARTLTLDPGANETVLLGIPVPADAVDGGTRLVVDAGDARLGVPVTVHAADATVAASADATHAYPFDPVRVTIAIDRTLPDIPLDVVVRHGSSIRTVPVTDPATTSVSVDVEVVETGAIIVAVQHPGGRVLDTARIPIAIRRDDASVATGTLAPAEVDAGGTLTLTLSAPANGTVNVTAPGYARETAVGPDATSLIIPVPADLATGSYAVAWVHDGVVTTHRVLVRGLEARTRTAAAPSIGHDGGLHGTVEVDAPRAFTGDLRVALQGADGLTLASTTVPIAADAGTTSLAYTLPVPDAAAGPVTVGHVVRGTGPDGPIILAKGTTRVLLPGTWLESVEPTAREGTVGVAGVLSTTALSATLTATTLSGTTSMVLDGGMRVPFALDIAVPENGTYPVAFDVVDADGRVLQRVEMATHGTPGDAPVTAHGFRGATAVVNGTSVLSPATVITITAEDPGIGLDSAYAAVDGAAQELGAGFTLTPGPHVLAYGAIDRAGNEAPLTTVRVIVDGAAPVLQLSAPMAGAFTTAGHEMTPVNEEDASGDMTVGVIVDGEAYTVAMDGIDANESNVRAFMRDHLGTDPADPDEQPAIPGGTLEDADGDGSAAVAETAWGTSDNDTVQAPWMPRPRTPPAFERPVIVAGATLRVAAEAADAVFPTTVVSAVVDGVLLASGTDALDVELDLTGFALGEHVLTVAAEDGVGNRATVTRVFLLVPATPEGMAAAVAQDPRVPTWPTVFRQFLEQEAVRLGLEGAAAGDSQEARLATQAGVVLDLFAALIPPAVGDAPGYVENRVADAVDVVFGCPCWPEDGVPGGTL